jgi:hypothetical protein
MKLNKGEQQMNTQGNEMTDSTASTAFYPNPNPCFVLALGVLLIFMNACMKVDGNTEHTATVGGEATVTHVIKLDVDSVSRLCSRAKDEGQCVSDLVSVLAINGLLEGGG